MRLRDCRYGVLVTDKGSNRIGMVKGITNNRESGTRAERDDPEHAIPLVEWAGGTTCGIHPGNLNKL